MPRIVDFTDEEISAFLRTIIPDMESVNEIRRLTASIPAADSITCMVLSREEVEPDEQYPNGFAHKIRWVELSGDGSAYGNITDTVRDDDNLYEEANQKMGSVYDAA